VVVSFFALLTSAVATPVASVAVRDAAGKWHLPFEARGNKASVLLFVAHDCPISNSYAPEINRLQSQFGKQNIGFYIVYVDSNMSATAARKHAHDYAFKSTLLLDTKHVLAKATGATVTPEAIVILPGGRLIYRGRIDNKHVAYGKTRRAATQRDLRDALQLVLDNKPPKQPIFTTAVGCFIPED
jgi:thiol-disulfide isomerase/thioredoxin